MEVLKHVKVVIIIIITLILELFIPQDIEAIDTILRVAFVPELPPYQFEENGQYKGMHIDILNKIAENNNYIIEYLPMESSGDCYEALTDGRVDIILGVIDSGELRGQSTESISQSSVIMIAGNKYVDSLNNKGKQDKFSIKTVLENGTINYSFIQQMNDFRYIVVSNQVRAFETLTSGKADILIGVKDSILYQLDKANIEGNYTITNNYMAPIEYTMVIRAGNEELLKKLNSEIRRLRISGEYEKIYEKWINEEEYVVKKILNMVFIVIFLLMIFSFFIFLFNFRLNLLLKKQVSEKTKELQMINKELKEQIIETRNNNELKNRIVEHNPSGIIAIDTNYKVTLFNQSACDLVSLNYFPIGLSAFDIPLIENILIDVSNKLFIEDLMIISKELKVKNTNGNSVYYRYDIYQLYNLDGSIRGAVITIDNVTKEIKMKEQIFEKEKNMALNQLIAGIAHEIRNPLTSIKTFVQLIPSKMDNLNFQYQLAEFVPKEVDRVNSLINNLIDYAKPETNNKHKVNVFEIVKSCEMLIKPTLENKNIEMSVSEDDEELIIIADKNQLMQVFINVILNGLDSIEEKMKSIGADRKLCIIIKLWGDNKNVYIQITDEGMGMREEEIKKATEPFYTNKGNGTGLGLFLSKQYIDGNNGTMVIESKPLIYTNVTMKFGRYFNE